MTLRPQHISHSGSMLALAFRLGMGWHRVPRRAKASRPLRSAPVDGEMPSVRIAIVSIDSK